MKATLWNLFWEILINVIFIICIYYLWNWLMTDLISAKKISIFESWGLRALVQFLIYNRNYERKN